jgi:hypothetical protein
MIGKLDMASSLGNSANAEFATAKKRRIDLPSPSRHEQSGNDGLRH